jgi:hypothetical protein
MPVTESAAGRSSSEGAILPASRSRLLCSPDVRKSEVRPLRDFVLMVLLPLLWIAVPAGLAAQQDNLDRLRGVASILSDSLLVAITGLGVEYREVDDQDLLERDVSMEITATLPGTSAGARSVRAYALHAIDTVNSDRTSLLEASGYSFTKGIGPARAGGGFWKKIVEPAVVLAASAVIVVLLFTVRSQ